MRQMMTGNERVLLQKKLFHHQYLAVFSIRFSFQN